MRQRSILCFTPPLAPERVSRSRFPDPFLPPGSVSALGLQQEYLAPHSPSSTRSPITSSRSTQLFSLAGSASGALASVVPAAATPSSVGFLQLVAAFLAGGLLCSTALAGVAAVFALGKSNLMELWSILKLITSRVWSIFIVGLKEARLAIRLDGKFQWKKAWQVFKAKLLETRIAAAEGVQAVRSQANFYAAAVGVPGLIPIQYVLDRMMPYSIASALEQSLKDAMKDVKNANVRRVQVQDFESGKNAPQLKASRVYDLQDAMAIDMDMDWKSDMVIKLQIITRLMGFKVPVTIQNVCFQGSVRIEMVHLMQTSPGFGALIVSFPTVPSVNIDVKVAGGEISRVPWLRSELKNEMKKAVESELLWPKRMVIPMNNVLTKKQLMELQEGRDPFRQAEELLEKQPILKEYLDSQKSTGTQSVFNVGLDTNGS